MSDVALPFKVGIFIAPLFLAVDPELIFNVNGNTTIFSPQSNVWDLMLCLLAEGNKRK